MKLFEKGTTPEQRRAVLGKFTTETAAYAALSGERRREIADRARVFELVALSTVGLHGVGFFVSDNEIMQDVSKAADLIIAERDKFARGEK